MQFVINPKSISESDVVVIGGGTAGVFAAISAAIHELNEDQHDIESTILTINQVKRNYSPWSSKAHSLRQLPK